MIINSRMERRLSIAATALLTAAIFVMPIKTRALNDARTSPASYLKLADATSAKTSVAQIAPIDLPMIGRYGTAQVSIQANDHSSMVAFSRV